MTEQDRINRESLLRRAAAAAGAVYVAPMRTAIASAEPSACADQRCRRNSKCKRLGGTGCRCIAGRCERICTQDFRCPVDECQPCGPFTQCSDLPLCVCFGTVFCRGEECVDFPSFSCDDYPACDKNTGQGCPPGMCCLDTCCPEGICGTPCGTGVPATAAPHVGSGPTLTR